MKSTNIRFKDFVKYVHDYFQSEISYDEVENILFLDEDYNKDSPVSLGKSLLLNRLMFSGTKVSGEPIIFDQLLNSGINVWIADNLKGKSTVFKVIKYALTGTDSIKPDIKKWISEIILEFTIGSVVYTIYIDKTGRDKGALYAFNIQRFLDLKSNQKLDTIEKEKEFEFKSRNQLEEKLQEFFFDHFSFYTLKYTSKSPGKDQFGLSTGNLSWSTYFKSIYLESKDYDFLFFDSERIGAQGRKIFEMILGLRLTYPINMLSLQRDRVLEETGKLKLVDRTSNESRSAKRVTVTDRYAIVQKQLLDLKDLTAPQFDEKSLIDEYSAIQDRLNERRKTLRTSSDQLQDRQTELRNLNEELRNLEGDKTKIKQELIQLDKKELNIKIYKDGNSFFSNLEIKVCPHCDTEISENRKAIEQQNHTCSLCGETSVDERNNNEELEASIANIGEERKGHNTKLKAIEKNIDDLNDSMSLTNSIIDELHKNLGSSNNFETDTLRLAEIEKRIEAINRQRRAQQELFAKHEDLIKEEAILNFQINAMESDAASDNNAAIDSGELKVRILDYALQALERKRGQVNKDLINKLEQLILSEVHAFGLSSIDKIQINEKYDLIFTQNQVQESFNDLNEGEKLRVKLAFYLSLIQLDIEHKLGRHPRFLIFDSPGSEEMIPQHLLGLADVFKGINNRLKDKLQIFIGTALREFSEISDAERTVIKEKNEFIF
jgi:hypothetical protein